MKNKRGMAIEMSVLFLVIIFSITLLMVNISVLLSLNVTNETSSINRKVEISQIGEKYINYIKSQEDDNFSYEGNFEIVCYSEGNNHYLKIKENGNLVLYISCVKNEDVKITSWSNYEN